jgi:hypothetical protein
MKRTIAILTLIFSFSVPSGYAAQAPLAGTLNVTIVDENGALVQGAPIYIYGEQKTKYVGGKEIRGSETLSMPAGSYRISSAIVRRTGDYFDRFSSNEAHIEVISGDNTNLVLTLKPLEPAVESMGLAELGDVNGLSDLARKLN